MNRDADARSSRATGRCTTAARPASSSPASARSSRRARRTSTSSSPRPFTALAACAHECDGSRVEIAAQNLYPKDSGAFTGEISAADARGGGLPLGHRRPQRAAAALRRDRRARRARRSPRRSRPGSSPIVCVGETLEEREAGRTLEVVERQVRAVPAGTSPTSSRRRRHRLRAGLGHRHGQERRSGRGAGGPRGHPRAGSARSPRRWRRGRASSMEGR